jgi:hypothetical protein
MSRRGRAAQSRPLRAEDLQDTDTDRPNIE